MESYKSIVSTDKNINAYRTIIAILNMMYNKYRSKTKKLLLSDMPYLRSP